MSLSFPMRTTAFGGLLLCVSLAVAAPFTVPLNQSQSSLTVQLCVAGKCDTKSSPVSGYFVMETDCVDFPTELWLDDLHVNVANSLNFSLSWGFLGALTASSSNVSVFYANPGLVFGPAAVTTGNFAFAGVSVLKQGMLAYNATGIPCVALQAANMLCVDSHDLAADGASSADWSGTLTAAQRVVTLVTAVDNTQPLDPNNPTLGTIHLTGTVRGSVLVPRPPGDVDGDGDVDTLDLSYFAAALAGPGVTTAPAGVTAYHFAGSDLDTDADVDIADFAALQRDLPAGSGKIYEL